MDIIARLIAPVCFLLFIALPTSVNAINDFTGLDFPNRSEAIGVNADGNIVVGFSDTTNGLRAFRWESGLADTLGVLPGDDFSRATNISADGNIIIGYGGVSSSWQAIRWENGAMTSLGFLDAGHDLSEAYGVNSDGTVIVGLSGNTTSPRIIEAFRWEGGIMTGLGFLPGGTRSIARDVSSDGSVIVGWSNLTGNSDGEAVRWENGVISSLGISSNGSASMALGVSANGRVIVGWNEGGAGLAFRWENGTMTSLDFGTAYDVNADGSVIVGWSSSGAVRWSEETGAQFVTDWLAGAGVSVNDWTLLYAFGVNSEGTVVVGTGRDTNGSLEGWIARVESVPPDTVPSDTVPPGTGLIGLSDFSTSLMDNTRILNTGDFMIRLPLNGAHHRPLLTYHGLINQSCLWATGDIAHYGRDQDANGELAEVGGCFDFIPQRVRLGFGVGKSFLKQDLIFSGKSHLNGEYVVAELDYQLLSLPIIASVTGIYGHWDNDVDRGYLNAGSLDQSSGDTDIESAAIRGRLDWVDAFSFANIVFSPRASFTMTHTEVDTYTETGGGFPVRFEGRNQTTKELRYGVDAEMQFSSKTWGRVTVEGVHQFDGDDPVLSGQVIGLFSFVLPGIEHEQDWARVGAEVEHLWSDSMSFSAGISGSSEGQDPTVSGSVSMKIAF